jgi:two-component system sensor histidine kinase KdpD
LQSAAAAEQSRGRAEETARQRQQDLMNITHQIQSSLIAVIGSLSGIKREFLTQMSRRAIEDAQALVEDGLAIGYGVTTALAREAGRETAFASNEIDARAELEKLCLRMQWTNARNDLKFSFGKDAGFPPLRMDRNVFTSVLCSLIHNAMKYADEDTEVRLECTFERRTDEAALKVKSTGEPIEIAEKERIFEKFYRGRSVERGRHHGGVGLGLWVARELMRASGGDLTVECDGRLSVFIVHVPETIETIEKARANEARTLVGQRPRLHQSI